ncbi:ABC transporter substrate-binding protein [Dolichospermum sp. ST_sed1]|nr:ABC transporter substrate-binding protein [Dolichospermum sp. ST_sed1]
MIKYLSLITFLLFGCTKTEELNPKQPDGNIYYTSRFSDPRYLDPQQQFDQASGDVVKTVYDSLLQYHYLKRPYELQPNLLAKMPEVSADGTTLTFELKKGVKFKDCECFAGGKGRELISDDVIYSLKRFADLNINVNSWFMLQGMIVGMDEFREKTKALGAGKVDHLNIPVEGLQKIDDYNFVIKLKQKSPIVLYAFASSATSVVPHEAVKFYGDRFRDNPVGTGPFHLKNSFEKESTLEFIKNPNYHLTYPTEGMPGDKEKGLLDDAGKQLPLVDKVINYYIAEKQPEMLRFKKGEISTFIIDRENSRSIVLRDDQGEFKLKDPYAEYFNIYAMADLAVQYVSFNLKDKLMQNKKLRQAMAYALNHQGHLDILSNGAGLPLGTPVPHDIAGSQVEIGNVLPEHNLEKAKQLLAEAGYPDGKGLPTIKLTFRSTAFRVKNAFEYYRYSLAKIGIVLEPEYLTFSRYLQVVDDGAFQMSESAWGADYPDSENFYQLLYGPNKAPGPNISSFANAEYDKLYDEIRFMTNGPERFAKFKRMSEIIAEEVPFAFKYVNIEIGMVQPWVRNFQKNYMEFPHYLYLGIKEKK